MVVLQPLMNNTKWRELRHAMLSLERPPRWFSTSTNGYRYGPDSEWFYHFQEGRYSDLLLVDIIAGDESHRQAIRSVIGPIHLPGEETAEGFRILGYAKPGQAVSFLFDGDPTP
jgi:hypothetical protein